jgi:hypothetical protein
VVGTATDFGHGAARRRRRVKIQRRLQRSGGTYKSSRYESSFGLKGGELPSTTNSHRFVRLVSTADGMSRVSSMGRSQTDHAQSGRAVNPLRARACRTGWLLPKRGWTGTGTARIASRISKSIRDGDSTVPACSAARADYFRIADHPEHCLTLSAKGPSKPVGVSG